MFEMFTEPANLVALFTAVGVFASILVVAMPMLKTDNLGNRMKSVALEREKLRARERARVANSVKEGRKKSAKKREPGALIKMVVEKLNLRKALADEKTELELIQAGFRGQSPLFIFLGLRFGLPFLLGGLAAIYFYFIKARVEGDEMTIKLYVLGAAFAGFYAPLLVVR